MSSQAPPDSGLQPERDVLAFGPPAPSRSSRRLLGVAGLALALVLVGVAVWRLLPTPAPDFTLADLQGAYAGMVRSDGTNDVSTVTRDRPVEQPLRTRPAECTPLLDYTQFNQLPAAALDGVSTYWLDQGSASISLFTYRYPSSAAARADFDTIATALDRCTGQEVRAGGASVGTVARQSAAAPGKVRSYLSYLVAKPGDPSRFSTDVALLDNTLTWQYRYDYSGPDRYTPQSAQQLMSSVVSQMTAVQDAHR